VHVNALAEEYTVIAITHRNPLPPEAGKSANIVEVRADLSEPHWEAAAKDALAGAPLYGIVHTAWPSMPRGGLLQAADETINAQLWFGAIGTVHAGRLLWQHAGSEGGRLVLLGSIVGSKPNPCVAAYSLGKATLENTARLLASELAPRGITVNTICPGTIAAGMNKQMSERNRLKEAALIPIGRLCEPEDVAAAVRYLLSPYAGFISGQCIGLTGAQL
jgi:3-oxoacyl-[acyl-carrier protein] reductase